MNRELGLAITAAKGATRDYLGGYRGEELEIFRHGMQTIVNVLETLARTPSDTQVAACIAIGKGMLDKNHRE